jgi:hypothetical protein
MVTHYLTFVLLPMALGKLTIRLSLGCIASAKGDLARLHLDGFAQLIQRLRP